MQKVKEGQILFFRDALKKKKVFSLSQFSTANSVRCRKTQKQFSHSPKQMCTERLNSADAICGTRYPLSEEIAQRDKVKDKNGVRESKTNLRDQIKS